MDQDDMAIAIIHDNASSGESLVRLLASAKLEAKRYQSAGEFLADVEQRASFQCIVLYQEAGDYSAFETLCGQELPLDGKSSIILLSNTDNSQLRQLARDLGAAGMFTEPADGEALLDAIRWQLCIPSQPMPGHAFKERA